VSVRRRLRVGSQPAVDCLIEAPAKERFVLLALVIEQARGVPAVSELGLY
jgi:hypothetical protein